VYARATVFWFHGTNIMIVNTYKKTLNCIGVFALLMLLTAALPAKAQVETYEDIERRLLEHPGLKALRFSAEAKHESAIATEALPDPVVSLGVNNVPIADPSFDTFLPTHKAVGVRQAIPNGGVRRARSKGVEGKAEENEIEAAWMFSRLRSALISALADRQRLEEEIALSHARDAKYAELQDIIKTEIDAGRPVVFRLAQVDVERAEVARQIVNLEAERADVDAQLIELVGSVPSIEPPEVPFHQWQGAAQEFFAVQLANAGIDVAQADIDEAKASFGPDWGVNLTYQQREEGNGALGSTFAGDDWFSAQVTFTVPLWAPKSQAPKLRAAKSRKAAAEQRFHAVARRAQSEWSTLSASRLAAERSVIVFRQKLAAIDEQIRASLSNYEAGIGDYSPIIDGELAKLSFQSQIATEQARLIKATARANSLLVTP
jgi:outer membrane protein TolC